MKVFPEVLRLDRPDECFVWGKWCGFSPRDWCIPCFSHCSFPVFNSCICYQMHYTSVHTCEPQTENWTVFQNCGRFTRVCVKSSLMKHFPFLCWESEKKISPGFAPHCQLHRAVSAGPSRSHGFTVQCNCLITEQWGPREWLLPSRTLDLQVKTTRKMCRWKHLIGFVFSRISLVSLAFVMRVFMRFLTQQCLCWGRMSLFFWGGGGGFCSYSNVLVLQSFSTTQRLTTRGVQH